MRWRKMEDYVVLTASHWVYLLVIIMILVFIVFRREVVVPSLVGIFILGLLAAQGQGVVDSFINGLQTIFASLLNAGVELFDIMLIITLMVAMLKSLQAQGADVLMVAPVKKLMVNPTAAFFVLGIMTYIAATFFWPTPTTALVGVVLIPVAIRMGLPAMGAAVSISLFGHGMALSGDLVIQGATKLTASSANVAMGEILSYTALFSFIVGGAAIAIAFYTIRRDMKRGILQAPKPSDSANFSSSESNSEKEADSSSKDSPQQGKYAKLFAILVPVVLLMVVSILMFRAIFDRENVISGGDATGFMGGTALVLLVLATFGHEGSNGFEKIIDHLREGFYFAIKIFAPVIPIAGFFFLGNPESAESILGEGTPGFLFDWGQMIATSLGDSPIITSFGIALVGILGGLDGSGFSGLPLTGALSAAIGAAPGLNVAILASLGQIAGIFVGGGTLAAWAFGVAADSGVSGVKPVDLVRRNFIPVMVGLFIACIVGILLM